MIADGGWHHHVYPDTILVHAEFLRPKDGG